MDSNTWNTLISSLPNPHLLQTWQWGQLKAAYNWKPHYKTWQDPAGNLVAAALILERTIALGGMAAKLRMLYVPKGPLLSDWSDTALRGRVLADLQAFARQRRAFFIKIDPDVALGRALPGAPEATDDPVGQAFTGELRQAGWHFSADQVQFRNTVLVDLTASEDEILARMKQKTRYNVRLAAKKGVSVRLGTSADFPMLAKMYAETAVRDGFAIRDSAYYLRVWQTFLDAGLLQPLIAEVDGQPVAALMLFHFAQRAWYIYGMSLPIHREKMPTYLLQWEAIRAAKAAGCTYYDLWGAPDEFVESDPLWGVFRFKRGLGGEVFRHIGAWDLPVRPWLYTLYTQTLPRILGLMRRRGKARTRRDIQEGLE
ncbi:MAG: aminoacyltransferase [Anaerolineae bacterium]|nr:aminoacyltransferase [Anaerolineae bacterium]